MVMVGGDTVANLESKYFLETVLRLFHGFSIEM